LKQSEKVWKEYIKLQALVDTEFEDSTFICHPESNFVHVTFDIFKKEKRTSEEEEKNKSRA
jgi:hypothetical protein